MESISTQEGRPAGFADLPLGTVDERSVQLEEKLLARLKTKHITIRTVNKKDLANEAFESKGSIQCRLG